MEARITPQGGASFSAEIVEASPTSLFVAIGEAPIEPNMPVQIDMLGVSLRAFVVSVSEGASRTAELMLQVPAHQRAWIQAELAAAELAAATAAEEPPPLLPLDALHVLDPEPEVAAPTPSLISEDFDVGFEAASRPGPVPILAPAAGERAAPRPHAAVATHVAADLASDLANDLVTDLTAAAQPIPDVIAIGERLALPELFDLRARHASSLASADGRLIPLLEFLFASRHQGVCVLRRGPLTLELWLHEGSVIAEAIRGESPVDTLEAALYLPWPGGELELQPWREPEGERRIGLSIAPGRAIIACLVRDLVRKKGNAEVELFFSAQLDRGALLRPGPIDPLLGFLERERAFLASLKRESSLREQLPTDPQERLDAQRLLIVAHALEVIDLGPAVTARPPALRVPTATHGSHFINARAPQATKPVPAGRLPSATARPPSAAVHPPRADSTMSLPPSVPVLRGGRFWNPTTAAELLGLPLAKELSDADLDPIALPILMVRRIARKATSGTLVVEAGGKSISIAVIEGVAYLRKAEHADLVAAFKIPSGEYRFDPQPPPQSGAAKQGVLALAVEGLKAIGRAIDEESLRSVLGDRMHQAPVIHPDKVERLGRLGLLGGERRLAEFGLDGKRSSEELVHHGGLGRHTTLLLLIILSLFDYIQWTEPRAEQEESSEVAIKRRLGAMQSGNHFDVLGVHWSAKSAEILGAYSQLTRDLAADGALASRFPEECRQMRERVDAAYAVLRSETERVTYRRAVVPNIDHQAVSDLLHGTIDSLELRGETQQARATRSTMQELQKSREGSSSQAPRASRPPDPTRKP